MATSKKKKKVIDPAKLEQMRFTSAMRTVFMRPGFQRISSTNNEFKFRGRTGELDDIFIYDNIFVICEYTVGKASSEHLGKKKFLFDEIINHGDEWISFYRTISDDFDKHVKASSFEQSDFRIKIVYCSKKGINEELSSVYPQILYLDLPQINYFRALTKIIHKSSRFEIFKFLQLEYSEIGDAAISSATQNKSYLGFLLPEGYSSFPKGYKVVSFYADPQSLLEKSYVLRRDSWRDPEGLYQRMLIPNKIRKMRQYLEDVKRVFVNNIIVTLPFDTALNNPENKKNLNDNELNQVKQVFVELPEKFNVVGIIDGQHRVLCYHEGNDAYEEKIKKLRAKQNLLVTGIIYPKNISQAEKSKFEAKLFLEINDTQARAKSALKQSIELILKPRSTLAISKAIVERLSRSGALKDLLQVHQFDEKTKIKTSSIVSYGLRPLVKFDGNDSLFYIWKHPDKAILKNASEDAPPVDILEAYIEFCVKEINHLLVAAKINIGQDNWRPVTKEGGVLSSTTINGFIVCLRYLIENNKVGTQATYTSTLLDLKKFKFGGYKSSHWKALGEKLFTTYF